MGDTCHLIYSSLSLTVGVAFVRNTAIGMKDASWKIKESRGTTTGFEIYRRSDAYEIYVGKFKKTALET
jgi:hypothetical protein